MKNASKYKLRSIVQVPFGGILEVGTNLQEYRLDLRSLNTVATVTLPRPYPTFLPYYLEHNIHSEFDISKVESLQFSIGPGIKKENLKAPHGVAIVRVSVE